jgi:hypothetical protein
METASLRWHYPDQVQRVYSQLVRSTPVQLFINTNDIKKHLQVFLSFFSLASLANPLFEGRAITTSASAPKASCLKSLRVFANASFHIAICERGNGGRSGEKFDMILLCFITVQFLQ